MQHHTETEKQVASALLELNVLTYTDIIKRCVPFMKLSSEQITVRAFYDKVLSTNVLDKTLKLRFDMVVGEFDRPNSTERNQLIQSVDKLNHVFFRRLFRLYSFGRRNGLKYFVSVLFWSIVILSVQQYILTEKNEESVLVRYKNIIRASRLVLPTYLNQKFCHCCAELLLMTGERYTLGGNPSRVVQEMIRINKYTF